ncbi:hypothetical protein [uncultured Kordia sp.]|uniref:hypothetical protein n=1 Tax=uncultured Kordia sp. TaxID=507699 RepID=UPI0026294987|nr:hypothetical protein [uncultured Kordia sp.]
MDKILSPIKSRVLQYIDSQGLTKKSFFEKTGISASNFKGKGAQSELGGDKIVTILTIYKNMNPYWLLLGKGNMLSELSEASEVNSQNESTIETIIASSVVKLVSPLLDDMRTDIKLLVKNIGELRLDFDDYKEEQVEKEKK